MHINLKKIRNIRLKVRRLYYYNEFSKVNGGGKSLICNNCTGAVVLHELGFRFDTPTVNLFIYPDSYLELLEHIDYYLSVPLTDITGDNSYPIGLLGNKVRIDFMHYASFAEAVESWYRRIKRIHLDELYVVLIERDGCTEEHLARFDRLPFEHKVALVHKPYTDLSCCYVMKRCEENGQLRQLLDYDGYYGRRFYDGFDWLDFLNIKNRKYKK